MKIRVQHINRQIYTLDLELPIVTTRYGERGMLIADAKGEYYFFDGDGHYIQSAASAEPSDDSNGEG